MPSPPSMTSKKLLYLLIIVFTAALSIRAQAPAETTDALELSVDDNMATPAVPKKAQTYVRAAMDQLRRHLAKDYKNIELLRDGEVIEITIPCADIFTTSTDSLRRQATERLRPLAIVVKDPRKYKVLVTVHSDDTGDEQWADSLTAARANAIDDALWTLAGEIDTNVIPYGIGKDEPRTDNRSMINRAANRRIEIFIIPDWGLLEMAGIKRK